MHYEEEFNNTKADNDDVCDVWNSELKAVRVRVSLIIDNSSLLSTTLNYA
jgi:hypothetical protein